MDGEAKSQTGAGITSGVEAAATGASRAVEERLATSRTTESRRGSAEDETMLQILWDHLHNDDLLALDPIVTNYFTDCCIIRLRGARLCKGYGPTGPHLVLAHQIGQNEVCQNCQNGGAANGEKDTEEAAASGRPATKKARKRKSSALSKANRERKPGL